MPEIANFSVFLVATIILLVIPGPAVLFVVSKSIDQGKIAGLISVLGISLGTFVHVLAAAFGISVLLSTSMLAFNILKYSGAVYLIYLGLINIFSKSQSPDIEWNGRRQSLTEIFLQGVVVNVLNPKTALFIFSFLPQFVTIGSATAEWQIIFLGLCFVLLGIVSDSIYAVIASGVKSFLAKGFRIQKLQKKISGSIYLALGIMALTVQPAKLK